MNYHPIIDLLKRIVVALPDYAGGGGDDTSPFELYKTTFIPVSDSTSVTFSLPPLSDKQIAIIFGFVDNPSTYLSESDINKITGFCKTYYSSGMFVDPSRGVSFGNDVRVFSAITTASSADYWTNGVEYTVSTENQTLTLSNTRNLKFIAGANYTVWVVFNNT